MSHEFDELLDVLCSGVFEAKKLSVSWVSHNGLRYHIESPESAAKGGPEFTALCGENGDCLHLRLEHESFLRCKKCEIDVTRSSVTGKGGDPVKTPLEVV